MKKQTFVFFLLLAAAAGINATIAAAQATHTVLSWVQGPVSVSAGGTLSLFNSDENGNQLFGFGAYADLDLKHRVGLEVAARWLPLNGTIGDTQANYLAGPRIQLPRIQLPRIQVPRIQLPRLQAWRPWKAYPYVKILGGASRSTFNHGVATGEFGTVAVGGGIDIPWKRNLTIRAIDYEYQFWPHYLGDPLTPHGFSSGVSYRFR